MAIDPLCIRGCILRLQDGCMSCAASSDLSNLHRLPVAVVINYVQWPCSAHESARCDTSKQCAHTQRRIYHRQITAGCKCSVSRTALGKKNEDVNILNTVTSLFINALGPSQERVPCTIWGFHDWVLFSSCNS